MRPFQTRYAAIDKLVESSSSILPYLIGIWTCFAYTSAFPPYDFPQLAFICFMPLALYASANPPLKKFLIINFLVGFCSWAILLSWFRHIGEYMDGWILSGYIAIFLISTVMALLFCFWTYFVRRIFSLVIHRHFLIRFSGIFGVAGLWVVIEWIKNYLVFGFPWLPLATTQWQNPLMLQSAAWLGSYGVSFLILLINFGIAFYLKHIFGQKKPGKIPFLKRLCPEFYLALSCVGGSFYLFTKDWPADQPKDLLFRACIVQPDIPQSIKWDKDEALNNWYKLENITWKAKEKYPDADIIFWPESATPTPILGDENLKVVVESMVKDLNVPLVSGNMAIEENPDRIYNGVFVIHPDEGVQLPFYKKRKLVPYGEYIPLKWLPLIGSLFHTGWDFTPGTEATVLPIHFKEKDRGEILPTIPEFNTMVGPLVCYEDIFPNLSRSLVQNGAEFLFVTTNNGWFGKEGAAYQHAAHSVLRAVENRRPLIRCGNAGWSGWIDEYGFIKDVFTENNTIYTAGYKEFAVTRFIKFTDEKSAYTLYGDWFVALCGIFFIRTFLMKRKS